VTEYLPAQPNELLIAGPQKPRAVRLGDQALEPPAAPDTNPTAVGWRYDESNSAIILRFIQPAPKAVIWIEW